MKNTNPTVIHSKIGASSCERWWNCPGSVALIQSLPPQPQSEYAAEGTAAHALAEHCLRHNMNAFNAVEETNIIANENKWTHEMAEAVQVYLNVIRNDMMKYKLYPSDIHIEHRFHLTHVDPDAFGTNDANLIVPFTKIIVYDYKHGRGVAVDAIDNKQGLYYAVGAVYGEDFDEVEIVIVQPRVAHEDGIIRRWTVTKKEMEKFEKELKVRIDATRKPNAERKCGEWCKKTFCPAMPACPEVRQKIETAAMTVFQQQDLEYKLPGPDMLTPLQLRHLLESIPLIDMWIKTVWGYAENQLNNGHDVLGFKLVQGRQGNRKWTDEKQATEIWTAMFPNKELFNHELKSPAQIEKILGKGIVDVWTERLPGKTIMVADSDPREEVRPDLMKVFIKDELI